MSLGYIGSKSLGKSYVLPKPQHQTSFSGVVTPPPAAVTQKEQKKKKPSSLTLPKIPKIPNFPKLEVTVKDSTLKNGLAQVRALASSVL